MSSGGGGGAAGGVYSGGDGFAGGARGRDRVEGSSIGGMGSGGGISDQYNLNPSGHRGFGDQYVTRRFETPCLNNMRAKQGAIVSKFMTFFERKCSLVIEMYEASFYRRKPNWDNILYNIFFEK